MSFKCPRGSSAHYRYKTTSGGRIRLGGCARRGRFIKGGVREVKRK